MTKPQKKVSDLLYLIYQKIPVPFLLNYVGSDAVDGAMKVISEKFPDLTEKELEATKIMFDHWAKPTHEKDNIPGVIDTRFLSTEKNRHGIYSEFVGTKDELIKYFLTKFSVIEVHWIVDYLGGLTKGYSVRHTDYEIRYGCECGTFFKNGNLDSRDVMQCCSQCGRSTKTWKMVSGRATVLIKTTPQKFLGMKVSPKVEEWNVGFTSTKFPQYDTRDKEYLTLKK